jgi:hypothetical protein
MTRPIPKVWYTADGRDVQIRQMDESHIINCIRLIIARAKAGRRWRFRWLRPLDEELVRRDHQAIALKLINQHVARMQESPDHFETIERDEWGLP